MTCFMRLVGLLVMLAMGAPPIAAFSLRRLAAMEYQAAMIPSLAACYIENGYDYVGNDLTNKPGSVDQCCGLCSGTKDCKAWSWSGYNGGTCWLKWAQGDVIVNPEVKSALLLFSPPLYCQLQNDVDYVDNDLVRLDSKTADGCCDLCHSYPGCRAYTWSDFGEGSCWLKSKVTKTVPKPGVKSAKAYPDVQFNCPNLEYGLDYVDHDIDNKHADKPEMCCDICKANPNCRAFSWSGHNSGTCWLKSMKGAAVWTPGVVSAQIAPNPPPCVLQDNMDLFDNDFANVPNTPDPKDCCDICRNKPPCKAFAWSDYQGGTCWLKTAKGTSTGKPGVKSGWI